MSPPPPPRPGRWPSLAPTLRNIVLPTVLLGLIAAKLSDSGVDLTYSPRRVIFSKSTLIPAAVAPWRLPTNGRELLSRLLQVVVMALLPRPASVAGMWRFWIAVALIRIPVAYLLTRSVGWALPAWFSHYSLYESSAGFGPSVLALIALDPTLVADILPPGHSALALYSTPILAAAFAWLENSAWTYGIAIALTLVLAFITRIPLVHTRVSWLYPTTESDSASDEKRIELAPPRAYATPPSRPAFLPILGSLSVLIPFFFISPTRLPFPDSVGPNPLLHVLFLSFPRPPSVEISQTLLTTTLDSFTPHMSGDLSISVFTHATSHPALENVRADYPDVEFFVDRDSHPDDNNDQYLHLAEAFRWAEGNPAEWVMLVEDDFPICPGGWDVIATTMNMLERDRKNGIVRAGFIGTGGSGLVIHKSYLDILQISLRAYSAIQSPIPEGVHRRAPDEVVQDCIMGRPNSLCERRTGKVVISSRLVLDHIGGMATTTDGKGLNRDKWRCGWRHAFHGDDAVEVVVV